MNLLVSLAPVSEFNNVNWSHLVSLGTSKSLKSNGDFQKIPQHKTTNLSGPLLDFCLEMTHSGFETRRGGWKERITPVAKFKKHRHLNLTLQKFHSTLEKQRAGI